MALTLTISPYHTCALRYVEFMPRMHHPRIRLGTMCPLMFGDGSVESMHVNEMEHLFLRLRVLLIFRHCKA